MATVASHLLGTAPRGGYLRVRQALLEEAGVDLTPAEVGRVVQIARDQSTLDHLSDAMARLGALPPATARAAQATENAVKAIDAEFGLLTSAEVAKLLGSSSKPAAVRSLANDMRSRGELLAIHRLNKYLYPGFQFDRSIGRVKPVVKSLLKHAKASGWDPEDVVLWLCSPTTYFEDEGRPVDRFDSDPDQVVDAARRAWDVEW